MSDQDQQLQQSSHQQESRENTKQGERRSGGGGGGGRHGRRRFQHQPQQQSQHLRQGESSINMDELRELVELIAANGFTDFELEREGFRVRLRRELGVQTTAPQTLSSTSSVSSMPIASPAPPVPASIEQAAQAESKPSANDSVAATSEAERKQSIHTIRAPIVGTFYRSPSPTAEPFVRVGSTVEPATVVCIIEAMKLMNEIQAETSGVVEKIYVENGQPVEYGQPLFDIRK